MNKEMETAINNYFGHITNRFIEWRNGAYTDGDSVERFRKGLSYNEGRKYIRIVSNKSAHSFIVNTEDDGFPYGTILKPASWKTPAKNHARGNVFGDYSTVEWTGPAYMK